MDAHIRALSVPNCNLILVRKTYPDLIKTHIIHLKTEMPLLGGHYHATDHIAYYPNGSKLFLSYVGSEADSMNLLSAEFLGAYFDELSVIPWEFFTKLCASVRVTDSSLTAVVRASTNPLGPSARQIKAYFVDKDVDPADDPEYNPDDWGYVRIDMQDNPYLDLTQYRKRFSGMPEHVRKAWLEGEFADENAMFTFHPSRDGKPWHVIHELDPSVLRGAEIYRSFDMGYFPDPAYCLWIAHLGNRYVAFKEQVWFKTTVPEIAQDILNLEQALRGTSQEPGPLKDKRIITTYCDPVCDVNTGADVMTIKDRFEMAGIPMELSINDREHYASSVHQALADEVDDMPKLQIYQYGYEGCPYLVKTLPMMQFDPKHPLRMADHKDDHGVVTLAYFLISSASLDRKRGSGGWTIRPWMRSKPGTNTDVLGYRSVKDYR
jgi:hypothetical protein